MIERDGSHLIGFFCDMPMVGSGYFGMVQMGLLAACRKAGCELVVKAFDLQSTDIPEQIQSLIVRSPLLGVVLPAPLCDMAELLQVLHAVGVPVARIAPYSEAGTTFDICIDNEKAAYDLTAYLIGLGHKRIAFVKGPPDHGDAKARFVGYRKAMGIAGLPVIEELCVQGMFDFNSGIVAGEQLLSVKPLPSAIFACNDEMAVGVVAVAHRLGLRIPEDFSLAGFDDSPLARTVWPELTTCRQKMDLMGYLAADFLIDPPAAPEDRKRSQDHDLVIRQSTAPVRE
ncbi:MAG: substrate-binding domain-containing protein [Alphaproteobacteria bacterium]|nr:substrate-binding domain-containing protein [Alphaproteobacteria bacterium]MDE2492328.1 substrate-binding domain-containing protein [Alphaproteobacteria bacterium]